MESSRGLVLAVRVATIGTWRTFMYVWRGRGGGAQRLAASMESSHLLRTGKRRRSDEASIGAQRLAASMESSPGLGCALFARAQVLNALRHQWNPHASLRPIPVSWSSAQRLAASMESSLGIAVHGQAPPSVPNCAQRLAASMESSLQPSGVCVCTDRAQRLAASMESSHVSFWGSVPPALGAQRLAASMESSRTVAGATRPRS